MSTAVDRDYLIGKVVEQDGIRLGKDDPAFALVTLNELILKDLVADLGAQLKCTVDEFGESAKRLDERAGSAIAGQVTQSAAAIRRELQQDIGAASLQAREIVSRVEEAHSRQAIHRWVSLGIFWGMLILIAGVFLGRWSVEVW